MKVLLIEDNENISGMMEQYLTLKGYQCVVTRNGRDGLKEILDKKYDVVLLDLAMPEFSGYEIIESLEKKQKLKEQKIIVLTAFSLTEKDMNDLVQRGIRMCLKKPVQLSELLKVIRSCTDS